MFHQKLTPALANPAVVRRREYIALVGAAMCAGMADQTALATAPQAAESLHPLNRFPRMMQEFLVSRVRQAHQRSVVAKRELETREDAFDYVKTVRSRIADCFGEPPKKTPLAARVTGIVERDRYRIEKIIFESRPNFPVTANLYLPVGATAVAKVPGVVGTCGHSANGKAAEPYQSFAQGLARKGMACLIYDPIGQGERLQYPDENLNSKFRAGVGEHIQAGNQQFLVGENLSMWRAWDGIRALDYLLSRTEIDPQHVGVTGNSGGGTMTTWLCGVESRWTMAAPACFVTTFLRNAENELPADTEQCPPRVLAVGLEHEDFLAALAPKPVVILAKERDFFDVRGSQEAYGRLKRLYTLLGKPENISLFVGPTDHGYSIENREAMYAWFGRATGTGENAQEPQLIIEEDQTLWCTKSGQVHELTPDTVFTFTRRKADKLQQERQPNTTEDLQLSIRTALRLEEPLPMKPPPFRILRAIGNRQYPKPHFTTYAVETERGAMAISYMLTDERHDARPQRLGRQALLYVSHRSADDELRKDKSLRDAIESQPQRAVFAMDVRGVGESLPNTCGANSFDNPYGCDYFYAAHGIMLDRPYLGQKTLDVLRILQWLRSFGYEQIDVCAKGWGSYSATLAAVLDSSVRTVELWEQPATFHQIATEESADTRLAYIVPGVLKHFDMPDCHSALGDRLVRAG
ncbi:MAG: prolyl oligopeptidase family serine peptidase [Pirellulaceae bacterium]